MRIDPATLALVLTLCPIACFAKTAPPKSLPPVRYTCEDGTRLRVAFSAPGVTPPTALVQVLGTGAELKLDQAPSADGGRYVSGTVEFWDKGQAATFTRGGTQVSCRPKR